VEFVSAKAREVLWAKTDEDVKRFWRKIRTRLIDAFKSAKDHANNGREHELEVDFGGRRHRLLVEIHEIDEDNCEAFLILIKDRESLESLHTDLRLATTFRNNGRLYRAMAHDLRQPIAAMQIYLQLLENTFAARSGAPGDEETLKKQAECVSVLRNEIGHLDRSLQFLLSETLPSDGVKEEFDLRQMITDMLRLIDAQAKKQAVAVEMALPEQQVVITGHRDRLKQAILNLVVNALEAMPTGGKLGVRLRVDGEWAAVTVHDTGPGIPSEVLARIFDMHFTTKTTGTGIGLWVARQTVRAMGGDVGVETIEGKGSEFRVNLPLRAKPVETV
jgi:signal transduction histidine kinase